MLKSNSNIQRSSDLLRALSKNAKQVHSLVVGADAALKHVANNKAFDKTTRSRVSQLQGYSQAADHVLSGAFMKSVVKAARPWTEKETAKPFDYKLMSRQIPTHVRTTKKHEHPFFGNVGGDEDLYS